MSYSDRRQGGKGKTENSFKANKAGSRSSLKMQFHFYQIKHLFSSSNKMHYHIIDNHFYT